ncbi:MAG TPA: hypothetical protein VHW23_32705 [Kofleriaceae bacterium]|nr:hypothetical protein [Kofleriaceae bacterium]
MLRWCALSWLVVAALAGVALGAPRGQRVVLADPDPELRHAMEQALAPYRLQVVIEGPAPTDAAIAAERADADTARFVVWRDGNQLVVYDRELGIAERRASQAGVLDPPTAAAAALTIKTMMRLPPPPPPDAPEAPAPPPAGPGIELRLQAQLASRIAHGDETTVTSRVGGALAIRPWPGAGWRFGVAVDLGGATDVNRASFKGTWSEWAALGLVSWTYARGALELEPHLGFGVRRSTLDGAEMNTPRSESATLATARAGLWARWRLARFTVGVLLVADDVFGTFTYTKTNSPAEVFQVPGDAVELGGVIAIDL